MMDANYQYKVVTLDLTNGLVDEELEFNGERIFYEDGSATLSFKIGTPFNDSIPLKPKGTFIAPFTKLYFNAPPASATVTLFLTNPAEIVLQSLEVNIDTLANLERTGTGGADKVSMTATSATILASDANRKRVVLLNTGVNNVYVNLGTPATVNDFTLGPGERLTIERYTGIITGICDTGLTSTIRLLREGQ